MIEPILASLQRDQFEWLRDWSTRKAISRLDEQVCSQSRSYLKVKDVAVGLPAVGISPWLFLH
jgi:hypothetical protein